MIRSILFLLFLTTTQSTYSQDGWYQQNSGTTSNLKSVFFTDVNTGYISGYSGILKTTNGGLNWTAYSGNLNNGKFFSVHFIGQTGFTVGGPLIFKTTDGGNSWMNNSLAGVNGLYTVSMLSHSNVIAAGDGKIIRSTNGGLNWEVRNFDSASAGIYRAFRTIHFTDSLNGFIGGYTLWVGHYSGLLWKTNNGGINWSPSGIQPHLTSVHFLNTATGYGTTSTYGPCCPSNALWKTTNGGNNWNNGSQYINDRYFNAIRFYNSSTGYTVGFKPSGTSLVMKTTTSGFEWYEQYTPPADSLNSIFLIDALTGYAVGNQGTILKTTNGGTSSVISISNEVPEKFKLYQNYPNPFNPSTVIRFDIAKGTNVKLSVFDVTGREMSILVNKHLAPGSYEYTFDAGGFPSGVYFYKLDNGNAVETKRMVLLK